MDKQPRVTDFVPQRYRIFAALMTLGLVAIGILEAIYACVPQAIWERVGGRPVAFDLTGPASLATWLSSIMLLTAGLVSVLVYSLRRFKIDDYKGRYRVWLWVGLLCFAVSIDATAGLRYGYQALMVSLTGRTILGDGSIWWMATLAAVVTLLGVRLLLDTRRCRGSTSMLVLAALLWTLAAATKLGWLGLPPLESTLIAAGCAMTGHLTLLVGLALHARYIMLEIQGLLPEVEDKPKTDKPKRVKLQKTEAGTTTRIDGAHKSRAAEKRTDLETNPAPTRTSQAKALSTPVPAPHSRSEADDELDETAGEEEDEFGLESSGRNRKSSRAERKRLRKERMEQQQRADR